MERDNHSTRLQNYRSYVMEKKWRYVFHIGIIWFGTLFMILSISIDLIDGTSIYNSDKGMAFNIIRYLIQYYGAGFIFGIINWYALPTTRKKKEK